MKKSVLLFLFFILISFLFADFKIEKSLIDTLTSKAYKNIEPLPEDVQQIYKSYIEKYPDGIMAYLIMTENSSQLWDANPHDILDNYQVIKDLMKMEDYEKYSDEFVLSYVCKTTISHEIITNYRKVFAENGLLDYVRKFPDLTDRIREINLWCRENMLFVSTSGRTQDPLSVYQKSKTGRCGEMQVFFISACRTVGIPARPAWTPWWAHTDNNHAWTEVFVDNKWHYAENAQPDYYLDSTWFSGAVTKALLVLARSSFPDSLDDVVFKSSNNNYINSTNFYQPTRKIKFKILDKEKNPADSAVVKFFAFNFSMLRSLLGVKADSLGIADVNISYGSFLVIAHKDSLSDFVFVPFGENPEEYELILEDKKWKNLDFTFQYPEASGIRKDDPEFFAERKKQSEEKYNKLIEEIQSWKIPQYAPESDSNFVKIFEKSRNNKQPLLNFIKENENIPSDFWNKLLEIDEKFFWQANQVQWQHIYDTFLELEENKIEDDKFSNLLAPSVFYEVLPKVRIPEKYLISKEKEATERISEIIDSLNSNFEINEDKAPTGLLSLDKMLEAEFLQDFQFKTLSCYILRANLIPAQYTRIPSTIMVMADSVWQNYDVVENKFVKPQDKKAGSLIKIEFELIDEKGFPVTLNPDNISTTIFQNGRFYNNDRQLDYDKEKSILSGELEKGDYQIQFGIRENGEITKVKLISLHLDEQTEIKETLIFKDFKRNWKNADKKYLDFISSFIEEKDKDWIVLLGDYDNEPVQRLATKVHHKMEDQKFVWIGKNESSQVISDYIISDKYEDFLEDNPELKHRLITFYFDAGKDKWKMFEGIWDLLFK